MNVINSQPKKIAVFGWAHSAHIQRWVAGLTNRGFHIKLISLDGKPLENIDTVIIPRKRKLSYLTQSSKAVSEVRKFRPDLVHAHYASGFGVWSLRCGFHPTIVSVWGSDIIDFPSNAVSRYLIKKVLTNADHITATSQLLKKYALKYLKNQNEKITVIPFGVTIPDEVHPLPPFPPKICFIKSHRKKYGPDILLRAIKKVIDVIPDLKLTMAGSGEITSTLKQMVSDLDLNNNVDFVGYIENKEIYSFLREHHFMVMPSIMESESFGVAVLEANICGRPVIASNTGGVPEVMIDNQTGILVPPENVEKLAEAIIKLGTDADLCNIMGKTGYDFVKENYDWEKSLDQMSEIYERLIYEH